MSEPISKEEQDDLRGQLFEKLCDIGAEKGFSEVELTQITTDQSGERMEWSIRVVFKKGVRKHEQNNDEELCV